MLNLCDYCQIRELLFLFAKYRTIFININYKERHHLIIGIVLCYFIYTHLLPWNGILCFLQTTWLNTD